MTVDESNDNRGLPVSLGSGKDSGEEENGREQPNSSSPRQEFGLPLDVVYKLAVQFHRQNDGKAYHVSYHDRLKLAAFSKQVTHGPCADSVEDVGYFDVVGSDRRAAWELLGSQSREECMAGFVTLLDSVCPPFRIYVEANKRSIDEQEKAQKEQEKAARQAREEQERIEELLHDQILRQDAQRKQIQEALNKQTYHEFLAYALQQYPNDRDQQLELIKQLQEQHYAQYMQQVVSQCVQQSLSNGQPSSERQQAAEMKAPDDSQSGSDAETDVEDAIANGSGDPLLDAPSMWTRKDIQEFKESIKNEGPEGVLKIGSGETVTVRVPTHEDGNRLFWEFATDDYDLGFGVFFEWAASDSNDISVHIVESDDELDPEPAVAVGQAKGNGHTEELNAGGQSESRPCAYEVVPVYRRDCHDEVYAGSHPYPSGSRGVYLLKFDNSYSLWRAKTLFYRVYYSR